MPSIRVEETTEANRCAAESAGPAQGWSQTRLVARLVTNPTRERAEREGLEREVARLRGELARQERLAMLGRVACSVAHDLNNVLTAILGHADLLELEWPVGRSADGSRSPDTSAPGPASADLEEIRHAVARGAALAEEVLAFGRVRERREAEVDLAAVVAGIRALLARIAGDRIGLECRLEAGLASVRLDPERLERIVVNLVANARHAIEARGDRRGRIRIEVAPSTHPIAGGTCLRVEDDGCGMDGETRKRIFEPFFTTRAATGGTGLGLADVADFVGRAEGEVRVESEPGRGTTITLEFPPARSAQPAPAPSPLDSERLVTLRRRRRGEDRCASGSTTSFANVRGG